MVWSHENRLWHCLHMKTKVVQHVPRINISMSQTQTQSQPHWFPAFVILTVFTWKCLFPRWSHGALASSMVNQFTKGQWFLDPYMELKLPLNQKKTPFWGAICTGTVCQRWPKLSEVGVLMSTPNSESFSLLGQTVPVCKGKFWKWSFFSWHPLSAELWR